MPYRCPKCVNTFKTIHLYNRHAASAKDCGVDQIVIARPQESQVTSGNNKREAGGSGWGGGGGWHQVAKKLKEDPDDEPVIISTSSSLSNNSSSRGSSTDYKRAQNGRFAPTGVPYSRNQSSMASYARVAAKIPCTKCDKKFDSKADLEKHDSKEHDENRCEECEDDFAWPGPDHDCFYTRYQLRRLRGDLIPAF